jgi:hypothetical protein
MATPYETGYTAGANVQPGQSVIIPDEFTADPTIHQQYVDGLQAGMNAQMAAAAAPAAAPVTFTLPSAVAGVAQEAPVTTAVTGVAQTAPAAVSMLEQMARDLDVRPTETIGEPVVTSSGGFALLEGLEDDLEKGSGKPFMFEEVGDKLIGIVQYRDEIRSDYANPKTGQYGMVMLLDIQDVAGELWSVRGYGSALSSQLEKANPQVGDGIAIKFIGMEQPKTAGYQAYKNYVVRVNHA